MTIKEDDHGLDENKTENLICLGQGCLDCLLELGMARIGFSVRKMVELNVLKNLYWRSIKTSEQGQEDHGADLDGKKSGYPLSGKGSSQIRRYCPTSMSALQGTCGRNLVHAFASTYGE